MQHSSRKIIDSLGALARTGWLAEQPVDFQMRMALAGHWVKLSPGNPLFCVGDPATAIFGLETGHLDLAIHINEEEEVLVHRAQSGFWIGEASLLQGSTFRISVWSATECRVFCIPVR